MRYRKEPRRNRYNRHLLNLERLEDRTVPAYTASLSGNVATFIGDSSGGSGDVIIFSRSGGLLVHSRGLFDAGFNSEFDFNSTVAGDQTLSASAASVINLTTGTGPDQIQVGGNFSSHSAAASVLLADFNLTHGGSGIAAVVVNDGSSTTGKTFTYASNSITATGINVSLAGPAFGSGISLRTGTGNDTVNLTSVLGIANGVESRSVFNGGGNDTVTIGSAAGSLDGFAGQPISVNGSSGTTAVVVNDSGDSSSDTYRVTATNIQREDGANDVTIDPTGVGVTVTLNAGGGDDTFNVSPRSEFPINIDGGGGTNTLVVDLAGTTNPIHIPITATSGHTTYGNRRDVDYQNIHNFSSINGTFGTPPTFTWDGAPDGGGSSADANWNTASNWVGDAVPTNGANLVFPTGAAQLTNNNNIANGVFNKITFSGTSYILDGNAIDLTTLEVTSTASNNNVILGLFHAGTLQVSVTNAGSFLRLGLISGSTALQKTGSGILQLVGANTYTGQTSVEGGLLQVSNNTAMGSSGAETVVTAAGTLQIDNITSAEPITCQGGVITTNNGLSPTLTGNINLASGSTRFNIPTGATMTLSGVISGAGNLQKTNTGTLVMGGAGSNTFTGATFVNDGTLRLSKTGGAVALAGTVGAQIGDGVGAANSAVLQESQSNNIADTYPIGMGPDGRLTLDVGVADTISFLQVLSGGSVAGGGGLTLGSNGLVLEGFGSTNNTLTVQILTASILADFDGQVISVLSPTKVVYNGQGGNDTLIVDDPTTFDLSTTPASITGKNFTFTNVENLVGNGTDETIVGPNAATTWNITGTGSGNLNGINFSGIEKLTSSNQDTLNYSSFTSPVAVNLGLSTTGMSGVLNGDTEVPPNGSVASGTIAITNYNLSNKTFDISVSVSDLDPATVTGFHIHAAPFGVNGPVIINLQPLGPLNPSGTGFTFNATGVALPPEQEAAFLGGLTYVNIHTSAFPNGVIRGQLFSSGNVNISAFGTATGFSQVIGFENVIGGAANDSLVGSFLANFLQGSSGNDVLLGGPGADTMFGDNNDDVLIWSNGDGSDVMDGSAGTDRVQVNGSTSANDQFVLSAVGTRLNFQRTSPGPFILEVTTTEVVTALGLAGNDNFSTSDLSGITDLSTVNLVGVDGNDTFNNITPSAGVTINLDGGPGQNGAGTNTATIDLAGTTNPTHSPTSSTSGVTSYGNRSPVNYRNIQNFSSINGTFGAPTPVISAPSNQSASEGTNTIFNLGSFTDANNSGNYTVTVNWGDGSSPTIFNQAVAGAITAQSHNYAQDGNFTVTITVADADGTSNPATFTANIGNVLPGITPPANQNASSGVSQSFNLGSFTDPGADAPWNITVNWGDGSSNTSFSVNTPGVIPAQNHTYANPGNFTVTITVNDDDGSSNSSFQVGVANSVPVVTPPGNQSANEGTSTSFNLGSFADGNNSGNYTVTINWGDGSANTVFNQVAAGAITPQNHTYTQDGNFTATITVADADGTSTPVSFTANVGNVPPGITPPGAQSAFSGVSQSFNLGSFTDPGADGPWNITINWGDGSANTNFSVNTPGAIPSQNHTYATPGNFTISITINDDDGSSNVTSSVSVANSVPVVTPPGNQITNEGTSKQFLLGAFTDANNSGNYTVTINWGDGTPNTVFNQTNTGAITFQNHTYAQDGIFPVTITVADVNGTSVPVSFNATVFNVTPVVTPAGNQNAIGTIAQVFNIGSFTDPGADAPWEVTINWGDGSPNTVFNLNTPGTIPPQTHTFANPGNFTVQVNVNDDDGPSANRSFQVHVIPPVVHVEGVVFRDFNANGQQGFNDIGQGGVVVFADQNGNDLLDLNETSTVTDISGHYRLDLDFEGAVNIREVVPAGFKRTTANPATLQTEFSEDTFFADTIGNARIITPTLAVSAKVGTVPVVQVFNADGTLRRTFVPFGLELPKFKGEVRVATGDFNDDGMEDIAVAAGPGGGPFVRIYDGNNGNNLGAYFVEHVASRTGIFVAAGDVNGDGKADLITSSDAGGLPSVKVFDNTSRLPIYSFLAFPTSFRGGVRVAAGDVNGDGFADIITTAGPGAGAGSGHVKVFSGVDGSQLLSFKPTTVTTSPGYHVAAGDLDGDGLAEIILGNNSGVPTVQVFNQSGQKVQTFNALPGITKGGVRVAAKDINGDGKADLFFTSGAGVLPRLRGLDQAALVDLLNKSVLDGKTKNGVFVG